MSFPGMVGAATFTDRQFSLLRLLDGQRSLAQIASDAKNGLGLPVSIPELENLVSTLQSLQLLVHDGSVVRQLKPGGLGPTAEALDWFGTGENEVEQVPEEHTEVSGPSFLKPEPVLVGDDEDPSAEIEDSWEPTTVSPPPRRGGAAAVAPPPTPPAALLTKPEWREVQEIVQVAVALRNQGLLADAREQLEEALQRDPTEARASQLFREVEQELRTKGPASAPARGGQATRAPAPTETEEAEDEVPAEPEPDEESGPSTTEEAPGEAGDGEAEGGGESAEARETDEELVAAQRARRRRRRLRLLVVLGVLGSIVGLLGVIPFELWVNERCVLIPSKRVVVRSRINGQIRQVAVREGDEIRKGDLVVALDDHQYRADLEKAEAKIRRALAELQRLQRGARREEIAQARQVVATKATEVRFAVMQARRLATLAQQSLVSKEKLEAADRDVAVRRREYGEAQAALELLRAGSRRETIDAKKAEIEQFKAELQFTRMQLDMTRVYSPIAGRIVTPRMEEKINMQVRTGDAVTEVVDTATMRAEIFVPERELDAVTGGLAVEVKLRSYPERSFWGKVVFVGQKVEKGEIVNTLRVISEIKNPNDVLKPEMTGHAKIYAGKRSVLYLITRRLMRWIRVEFVI